MSKNRTSRFIPIIIAVSIVAGILIGTFYANHFSGNRLGIINTSSNIRGTRPPLFLHSCQRPGGSKLRLERKL